MEGKKLLVVSAYRNKHLEEIFDYYSEAYSADFVFSSERKRLYNRMQHGLKAKQDVVDTLQAKRDAAKEKTNDDSKRSNKRKKKSKN